MVLSNFLSEGVRLGLDMKIARMGSTKMYIPFWLLIERPRMTPYHKKLQTQETYTKPLHCCTLEILAD